MILWNFILKLYLRSWFLLNLNYTHGILTWNYNTDMNNMSENSFMKSIEFGMALKMWMTLYEKKQKYFSLPDHQLARNLILVFGLYERTKRG